MGSKRKNFLIIVTGVLLMSPFLIFAQQPRTDLTYPIFSTTFFIPYQPVYMTPAQIAGMHERITRLRDQIEAGRVAIPADLLNIINKTGPAMGAPGVVVSLGPPETGTPILTPSAASRLINLPWLTRPSAGFSDLFDPVSPKLTNIPPLDGRGLLVDGPSLGGPTLTPPSDLFSLSLEEFSQLNVPPILIPITTWGGVQPPVTMPYLRDWGLALIFNFNNPVRISVPGGQSAYVVVPGIPGADLMIDFSDENLDRIFEAHYWKLKPNPEYRPGNGKQPFLKDYEFPNAAAFEADGRRNGYWTNFSTLGLGLDRRFDLHEGGEWKKYAKPSTALPMKPSQQAPQLQVRPQTAPTPELPPTFSVPDPHDSDRVLITPIIDQPAQSKFTHIIVRQIISTKTGQPIKEGLIRKLKTGPLPAVKEGLIRVPDGFETVNNDGKGPKLPVYEIRPPKKVP